MSARDVNRLFGERVHHERTELGWSMRDLGVKAGGFDAATVMRAEKGTADIWLSTAVRLAAALQVSLDGLVAVPACWQCEGEPPEGYICRECGRGAR
jgi:transcriptional regulator with XRE-family HTH domain